MWSRRTTGPSMHAKRSRASPFPLMGEIECVHSPTSANQMCRHTSEKREQTMTHCGGAMQPRLKRSSDKIRRARSVQLFYPLGSEETLLRADFLHDVSAVDESSLERILWRESFDEVRHCGRCGRISRSRALERRLRVRIHWYVPRALVGED